MEKFKRYALIALIVIGVPIGSLVAAGLSNNFGFESIVGLPIGIIGMLISLVSGVTVSYAKRQSKNNTNSSIGYLLPAGLTLLIAFIAGLLSTFAVASMD
ncbi:MAG TPA: hypothetical protein VF597_00815 [Candidatus Saccharimonadales bacterium]